MGEGKRREAERADDKRTADVRRYVDSLTRGQRAALTEALAARRQHAGNQPLDIDGLMALVEGLSEDEVAKQEALAESLLTAEEGEACACGAPATHRLSLAVWGKGQFKAVHRPAVIPVGGVFFCVACAKAVPIPDDFKVMIDGQLADVGEPPRDWERVDRQLVALNEAASVMQDEVFTRPAASQGLCAHAGCGLIASHRPEITIPALGVPLDEHDPAKASAGVWMCEAHAVSFLAEMPEEVKQSMDAAFSQSGKARPDWARATCEAIPAQADRARLN